MGKGKQRQDKYCLFPKLRNWADSFSQKSPPSLPPHCSASGSKLKEWVVIAAESGKDGRGGGWTRRCIRKKTGGEEEQSGETVEDERKGGDGVNRRECKKRSKVRSGGGGGIKKRQCGSKRPIKKRRR